MDRRFLTPHDSLEFRLLSFSPGMTTFFHRVRFWMSSIRSRHRNRFIWDVVGILREETNSKERISTSPLRFCDGSITTCEESAALIRKTLRARPLHSRLYRSPPNNSR